ncbi:hypothetical protein [Serinicoccus sediminis]|uniref:hypothetical protein n=1 Tax=Serinicoccus sediminis TaxID=2306021 RepID=UPI00102261B8|nr:hypothetical protein [Serinicoccus sediminis]
MTTMVGSPSDSNGALMRRTVGFSALGALAGLLLGVVVTLGIALWGMSQVSSQGGSVDLLPIIELQRSAAGDVTAQSGNGIVVLPLAGILLGTASGLLLGLRRPR